MEASGIVSLVAAFLVTLFSGWVAAESAGVEGGAVTLLSGATLSLMTALTGGSANEEPCEEHDARWWEE